MAIGWAGDLAATAVVDMETPLLPQQASDALQHLSADALRVVVEAAANALISEAQDAEISALDANAVAAASCVLVRCAREAVEGEAADTQYRNILLDCGLHDEELTAKMLPLLQRQVPRIQAVLRATSFDFAQVVDISWRLDYVLRSSSAGNIQEPIYYVQLKVQSPQGPVRDVTFSCSVEGLRDLVYRLQDATNSIEKIASAVSAHSADHPQVSLV